MWSYFCMGNCVYQVSSNNSENGRNPKAKLIVTVAAIHEVFRQCHIQPRHFAFKTMAATSSFELWLPFGVALEPRRGNILNRLALSTPRAKLIVLHRICNEMLQRYLDLKLNIYRWFKKERCQPTGGDKCTQLFSGSFYKQLSISYGATDTHSRFWHLKTGTSSPK